MTDHVSHPYDTHLDIRYGPLELVDVQALVDASTHPWYNQTLCKVTTPSCGLVWWRASTTGTSTTPRTSSSTSSRGASSSISRAARSSSRRARASSCRAAYGTARGLPNGRWCSWWRERALCHPATRSLAGLGAALVMLAAPQKGGGGLLVGVYSKLFLIQPDGTQDLLAHRANGGVLSTDGRHLAFTIVTLTTQSLVVLSLEDRTRRELLTLPQGSYFHHVGWAPDGKALAYEVIVRGKSDEPVLAPFSP